MKAASLITSEYLSPVNSRSAIAEAIGSTLPREYTRPVVDGEPGDCGCGCALTSETSLGFAFDLFCSDIVGRPLDPWQRWLGIHALEQLPDGRPRYRQILVLVARQNGKTEILVLLSLFWLYVLGVGLVLGTSTKLDYARESWLKVVNLARSVSDLNNEIARVRNANGEQEISTLSGSRYKIAASNEEGGRSLTVSRLVEDELRQHKDWSAHDAAENAMNAVPDAQAWAISNAGDDRSVVLNALQEQAQRFIATGEGDYRLGYFGWTAPDGCDLSDVTALAAANPNLGRRIDTDSLVGRAQRAKLAGGEQENGFRTEVLCQRVKRMHDMPVTLEAWAATAKDVRPDGLPVFFIAIAREMRSATIAVAATHHGIPHVEIADHRAGTGWITDRVKELSQKYDSAPFAAYAAGPVKAWVPALKEFAVDLILFNATETASACGHLQHLSETLGFTHSPNQTVLESLAGAERREIDGGGWVWDWKNSTSDLAPIAAETGALWLLESHGAPPIVFAFS